MRIAILGALGCALAAAGCSLDEDRCQGYGFERGTPQFSQCLMQINQTRSQALIVGGQQLMVNSQPPPPQIAPQMVCTPVAGGKMVCQ